MTEEGRTVKSVRLALKVVVQNDGEIVDVVLLNLSVVVRLYACRNINGHRDFGF